MLALMQRGMLAQFATQYQLLKGKYLVPVPPKRAPSAYLLYSQEARQDIEGGSIAETSRKIGAQWKELSDEQKESYSKKAQQLQAAKSKDTEAYNQKYKWLFQNVSARNLIMADFYKNHKFTSLAEGNEALKQHIEKMSTEQKQSYNKKVAELKAEKEKKKETLRNPSTSLHFLQLLSSQCPES